MTMYGKKYHSEEVLQKTSVQYLRATSRFQVEFIGVNQQLKQSFKSLRLAVEWAMGITAADKDRLGILWKGLHIEYAGCIYIYTFRGSSAASCLCV